MMRMMLTQAALSAMLIHVCLVLARVILWPHIPTMVALARASLVATVVLFAAAVLALIWSERCDC